MKARARARKVYEGSRPDAPITRSEQLPALKELLLACERKNWPHESQIRLAWAEFEQVQRRLANQRRTIANQRRTIEEKFVELVEIEEGHDVYGPDASRLPRAAVNKL